MSNKQTLLQDISREIISYEMDVNHPNFVEHMSCYTSWNEVRKLHKTLYDWSLYDILWQKYCTICPLFCWRNIFSWWCMGTVRWHPCSIFGWLHIFYMLCIVIGTFEFGTYIRWYAGFTAICTCITHLIIAHWAHFFHTIPNLIEVIYIYINSILKENK